GQDPLFDFSLKIFLNLKKQSCSLQPYTPKSTENKGLPKNKLSILWYERPHVSFESVTRPPVPF
ncbi:MAG: hypothetical protein SAL70_39995, partial [Scytonema sp. PMC 1070.18]|nr:hypothetical protein [Scytonema sp. PMC 1070.18]